MDVVTRHALAIAPATSLIRAVIRPANRLRVTRSAAEVGVNELAARGDARRTEWEDATLGLVEIGSEISELAVREEYSACYTINNK